MFKKTIQLAVVVMVTVLVTGTALASEKASHKFPYGYCTWYVADNNGTYVAYIPFSGNANQWLGKAQANGFKTKDRGWKPKKYSIVVTNDDKTYGHVALVDKVESSKFRVTEMNVTGWAKASSRWIGKNESRIQGFILTKKAVEQYEDGDKDEYKKLKKQYQKYGIWYDGKKQ